MADVVDQECQLECEEICAAGFIRYESITVVINVLLLSLVNVFVLNGNCLSHSDWLECQQMNLETAA